MLREITVHLLLFSQPLHYHIEAVLEKVDSDNRKHYYGMDRWQQANTVWTSNRDNSTPYSAAMQDKPCSQLSFSIQADDDEIIKNWKHYKGTVGAKLLGENCAVAMERFLAQYAGVNMGTCLIRFPEAVMAAARKQRTRENNPSYNALKALVDHSEKAYKFNALYFFYDQLQHLTDTDLAQQLDTHAKTYLADNKDNSYQTFKTNCTEAIVAARNQENKRPETARILGNIALTIVCAGIFYLAACLINKKRTGNFWLFNSQQGQKIDTLRQGVKHAEVTYRLNNPSAPRKVG